MTTIKGVLHVHSTWSDGEFTLAELRERFVAAGCRFAFVTDHANYFDAQRAAAYAAECASLSDDRFLFVAGLEYGCRNRMHVLGFGVADPLESDEPEPVFAHVRARGGVVVVAHPADAAFAGIESFGVLPDGIEAWNSKYDGRYAPRAATFALIRRLQQRAPALRAFYGQDLHWRTQFGGLFVEVTCAEPTRALLLESLRNGAFVGVKGDLRLPSDGAVSPSLLATFERAHARSQRLRAAIKSVRRAAGRFADRVPKPVKAQLRRLF